MSCYKRHSPTCKCSPPLLGLENNNKEVKEPLIKDWPEFPSCELCLCVEDWTIKKLSSFLSRVAGLNQPAGCGFRFRSPALSASCFPLRSMAWDGDGWRWMVPGESMQSHIKNWSSAFLDEPLPLHLIDTDTSCCQGTWVMTLEKSWKNNESSIILGSPRWLAEVTLHHYGRPSPTTDSFSKDVPSHCNKDYFIDLDTWWCDERRSLRTVETRMPTTPASGFSLSFFLCSNPA